jgi:hypothetical protein
VAYKKMSKEKCPRCDTQLEVKPETCGCRRLICPTCRVTIKRTYFSKLPPAEEKPCDALSSCP